MAYKAKKKASLLKESFREARQKEWQCCQFQTRFKYQGDGLKIRQFRKRGDALKFADKQSGKGKFVVVGDEPITFSGLACNGTRNIHVVYYADEPTRLEPSVQRVVKSSRYSKKPVCNIITSEEIKE